jgi:hypothetical protein
VLFGGGVVDGKGSTVVAGPYEEIVEELQIAALNAEVGLFEVD